MDTILIIAAIICFGLAAFGVGGPKINLGWIGLGLWAVTLLTP